MQLQVVWKIEACRLGLGWSSSQQIRLHSQKVCAVFGEAAPLLFDAWNCPWVSRPAGISHGQFLKLATGCRAPNRPPTWSLAGSHMQTNITLDSSAHQSIEQRILSITKNAELMPIKMLQNFIPLAYQTIRNQIHKKTFFLKILKINRRNFVRTRDLIRLIKSGFNFQKKVGRKKDCERAFTAKKVSTKKIKKANFSICSNLLQSKERDNFQQKIFKFLHFSLIKNRRGAGQLPWFKWIQLKSS